MLSLTRASRAARTIPSNTSLPPRRAAAALLFPVTRRCQLHATAARRQPYKNAQDRDSLKPQAQENTKSGSDDDVSSHGEAAFNPKKTDPQDAKETAGKDTDGNPLDVSPANQEMSKPQGDKAEGEKRRAGSGKEKSSGGKIPPKHGKGQ